jgi:hypothetical protein
MIPNYQGKVTLRRVRLNSQGYTSTGHYYGVGQHLYWFSYEDDGEDIFGFFRAVNRIAAKRHVQSLPHMSECKFYS